MPAAEAIKGGSCEHVRSNMTPRSRKLLLTTHICVSVGWLGAVLAYLALALTGLTSTDVDRARAAFVSMEAIGWSVLVPCSLAALLTGVAQSLATEWGLFRYYWISTKLLLTAVGTAVLLGHMRAVGRMASIATASDFAVAETGRLPTQLVLHAAGGLLLLIVAAVLSTYKPWGRTAYGRRVRSAT